MQVIRPIRVQQNKVYGGTDYGPRQQLLVEAPNARLMWVPGHTAYIGRHTGSVYAKAGLLLVRDTSSFSWRKALAIEPGRLTMALLKSELVQSAVVSEWGQAVADAIELGATVLLEKDGQQ